MSEFSKSIYELRHAKKLSQRLVSQDLGISQALLSHYENGVRQPKLGFVRKIASYYGVSSDDLLGCVTTDARQQLPCEARLISVISELMDFAEQLGEEKMAEAAARYLETGVKKARLVLENPNGAYNPHIQIEVKTAEAALYEVARDTK